ncbi:MAG: efflux RND transporter periplasmic adaptor subunit [Anaerolineales bacterium]|nr:MAG: efflux RND transporter periplasmic adaptor subunit [Anaerolineales bacterium]
MHSRLIHCAILLVLIGSLVSACGSTSPPSATEAASTQVPVVVADLQVVAEGRLVPNQFVTLAFKAGGQVAEVLVNEGETVTAGQTIARLTNQEQLEAAVASAEMELLNAQQMQDALVENAGVNDALALQAIAYARDAVRDAERYYLNLNAGSRPTDIDEAKANVVILKDSLDQAQKKFNSYENKPEDNLTRATLLSKLAEARQRYNNAVRLLNNLQGSANELDLAIAQADIAVAEAQLALAEQDYADLKDGPDPDEMASAAARINAAQANLQAARVALENIELLAPFDGTIVDLRVKAGELVNPGQPVLVLADFSQWVVETEDLTELEVPDISLGQATEITPDALPDLDLSGAVVSISDLYEEKRGDVTYTARIELDESDPRLRWGMTVVVNFLK